MKPPYCEIHGLVCTDVISSVDIDGADKKISSQAQPGQRLGEVQEEGRNPRKITLNARFLTEEDLDEWMGHINSAPEDCEAYPFRDDRCVYVKSAFAHVLNPEVAIIDGQETTFFQGKAALQVREPWVYGIEKGIRYESPHAVPITISGLEHEGTVENLTCLDKLAVVGQYNTSGYVENLALTCTPLGRAARSLILNTKLMRGDLFEADRFGNVEHSYESAFDCNISALQSDLQGATYLAYCTISNGKLTISGEGKCIFPFYGPLPISAEKPYIDLDISALGAYAPKLVSGAKSDLSDLVEIPVDLQVGTNRVYIPDHEGDSDLFFGFMERRCWISTANMNYAVGYTAGGGNSSGAICIGGYNGTGNHNYTQKFNGTTWTTGAIISMLRRMHAGGGAVSDAICMGGFGSSSYLVTTEEYNGTSWSYGGNLTTGRNGPAGGGNSSGAICMGGKTSDSSPYYTATTEEYNGTAWSSGGALGDAKTQLGGGGNAISAMCCGGYDLYSVYAKHEIYNGSAWQQAGNLSQARSNLAADGDSELGIAMGGDAGNPVGTMEEYDGTAWSAGGSDLITARYGLTGGGTSISAICMGGVTPTGINLGANYHANTETYGRNGSMTLNSIKAVVKRYIDPAVLPTVDPGDTFSLKIDSDGAEELTYLELYFRDAWWF